MARTQDPSGFSVHQVQNLAGNRLAHRRTNRLLLRPPRDEDLSAVIAIFTRPETTAHRPDPKPETASDCEKRLGLDIHHWQKHGFGRWALELTGKVIGFGGLTFRDGFSGLNLSYHIHPDYWRQGYASEFAPAAVDIALQDLKTPRVLGVVRHVNLASQRVLEKAGLTFKREIVFGGYPGLLYLRDRL